MWTWHSIGSAVVTALAGVLGIAAYAGLNLLFPNGAIELAVGLFVVWLISVMAFVVKFRSNPDDLFMGGHRKPVSRREPMR